MKLEQRIAQLEKRCGRLTALYIGTLAVAAVVFLGGAASQKNGVDAETVRTQRLEIVDGDGAVRVRLGQADAGYGVVVYDENGHANATLTDAPLGAVIQLSKQGSGIRLQAGKDGAGFSLRDTKGKPRAIIFVSDDESQIMLKNQDGNTVFSAPKLN